MKKIIGLHKLYEKNSVLADEMLWGRKSDPLTRRGFLRKSGLISMGAALGASIPFADNMPAGLIPAAFSQTDQLFELYGKDGLTLLNDRPVNAETPPHLLDDRVTPASRLFIRNNGIQPNQETVDPDKWVLTITGESVVETKTITLNELKNKFAHHTLQLQLECGGNGRSEFFPPAKGNQWSTGAIGCPEWTGVKLSDVLKYAGIKENAIYVAYEGEDRHLSGDPLKKPISRGVPLYKALEDESLLVWDMNGEPLPLIHGAPLRMICSGWPASVSGKWLSKILIRDQVHDGPKMKGQSYRVPCKPVAPGTEVADEDMCIIESMPVKSIITYPKSGITHNLKDKLSLRGHAWAGDFDVKNVYVSIDFGANWELTKLEKPVNKFAWQHWKKEIVFPETGYYEVWVRAEDEYGNSQPVILPQWNPRGYLNNACHRLAISVSV
jgi:DMSO/TMAO reductase YedYZ molybdopterin-dependent catalytic subunit|tara:strand:+ start:7355 stop:8671 length:1317 start_codon:yes stop_codon:yes gene_type:complete